jgi:transcriptional regulator with XRE-family HTH domain
MPPVRFFGTISDLGSALKARRVEREISRQRLSSVMGLGQSTVASIEREAGDPKLSTIVRIAEALGYRLALVPLEAHQLVLDVKLPPTRKPMAFVDVSEDMDLTDSWHGDGD